MKKLFNNIEELYDFVSKFYKEIPHKSTILLKGEIGAGKTTFVKAFLSNWGLDNLVSSPTFTIMNEYKNDKIRVFHFDFYRLNTIKEIQEIGLEEFISIADYVFIEWPELASPLLNIPCITIEIKIGNTEESREFNIIFP